MQFRSWLAAATLAFTSVTAHAGSFDPSGDFTFDPAAVYTNGFDAVPAQTGVKLVRSGDAVDGASYLNVSTQNDSAVYSITLPQTDASYVARVFARTNRIVATIDVGYPSDGGSPSTSAMFYPSGTVTTDGWYELVTNPFSVQGSRKPTTDFSVFASGADVDALEVVPSGTFQAAAKCAPPVDAACGPHQFCESDWCRDGNPLVPPLPPPSERDALIGHFRSRMQMFFGGRFSRIAYLPNALATLDGLHAAPDAWSFWNGIITAIHRLHDWHTTVSSPFGFGGRGLLPVCFAEGDADLSHAIVPKDPNYFDVLVSHVGPAGTTLEPGDRLVAINGMHPIAFVESLDALDWGMWRADDPDTHAEAIERMVSVIRRWASNITVMHCDSSNDTCGAPQTIAVDSLPVDDGSYTYPYCDHRPLYHLGSNGPNPVTHDSYNGPFYGVVTDSQPGENIYGMVWNDAYLDGSGTNPYQPAYDAFAANAGAVILDHRLGDGGTVLGAQYLTSLWRTPATIAAQSGFNLTLGQFDAWTPSFGLSFYSQVLPTDPYDVGGASALTKTPVALLIARDGSASDWFPFGMQGGASNIRVFGRHTAGAFSSYFVFDYYGGLSWRMASGDLLLPDGSTHLGTGVRPDEEIVPLQSDLLHGIDTAYARALDWVRTCTTCRQ
ncbi:MAG TPA: S41 family peptidase [Polyangiaceae bacterium]|jgi:hypothetical protein